VARSPRERFLAQQARARAQQQAAVNAARTPFKAKPFKPYTPPRPPAGSYDPALDAAREAANRGYGDVQRDTERDLEYAGQDFQFGQDAANQAFNRYEADFNTNTSMLKRQYDILAGRQAEQANVSGVFGGGALLEAAAKRQTNHGLEQTQLDTGLARAREDRDIGIGRMGVDYQRGTDALRLGQTRAGRENQAFGLDTAAQRAYQAAGMGYVPPGKGQPGGMPRNEFTNKSGAQRRRIVRGGVEYIVAPDGTVVHKKRVR
jgi:hypothetical protein